jgi:hypothetical protein
MDPGDFEGLVYIQGREQTREARGQHRLAGAGRSYQEQVMPARGRHLQG